MLGGSLLLLAIVAALEIARRSTLLQCFARLGEYGQRALRLLARKRVSDWSKERASGILARRLGAQSLHAAALIMLVAAPLVLVLALDPLLGLGTRAAFVNPRERLVILLMVLAYGALRRRVVRRVRL
jgi:hypothetical protein